MAFMTNQPKGQKQAKEKTEVGVEEPQRQVVGRRRESDAFGSLSEGN